MSTTGRAHKCVNQRQSCEPFLAARSNDERQVWLRPNELEGGHGDRLDTITAVDPNAVILMIGANDVRPQRALPGEMVASRG